MQLAPAAAPLPATERRLAGSLPLLVLTICRDFSKFQSLVFLTTATRMTVFCNALFRRRPEVVPATLRAPCSAAPVSARPKAGTS